MSVLCEIASLISDRMSYLKKTGFGESGVWVCGGGGLFARHCLATWVSSRSEDQELDEESMVGKLFITKNGGVLGNNVVC